MACFRTIIFFEMLHHCHSLFEVESYTFLLLLHSRNVLTKYVKYYTTVGTSRSTINQRRTCTVYCSWGCCFCTRCKWVYSLSFVLVENMHKQSRSDTMWSVLQTSRISSKNTYFVACFQRSPKTGCDFYLVALLPERKAFFKTIKVNHPF